MGPQKVGSGTQTRILVFKISASDSVPSLPLWRVFTFAKKFSWDRKVGSITSHICTSFRLAKLVTRPRSEAASARSEVRNPTT